MLTAIVEAWEKRRAELVQGGLRLAQALQRQAGVAPARTEQALEPGTLHSAFQGIARRFDSAHGGWGSAPKFPQPMILERLLRYHVVTGEQRALQMATRTVDTMARGGMYDQLGGGFHRYSVDQRWLVPHFERMLYDNSQLARVYLHAWQLMGYEFL